MIQSISSQAFQLLCAGLLGIALGLRYDVLRVLRRKRHWLTHVLDFWFWLTTLLLALLFAVYVGQGELHVSFYPVIVLGAWLWHLTLSRPFCRIFGWILHVIFAPIRLLLRFFKKYFKKIAKSLKKYFSSAKKWFMIKYTIRRKTRQRQKGGNADAVSQGIPADQNRDPGFIGMCYRYPGTPAEADQ